jgi:protein-tyrosine phosphatase
VGSAPYVTDTGREGDHQLRFCWVPGTASEAPAAEETRAEEARVEETRAQETRADPNRRTGTAPRVPRALPPGKPSKTSRAKLETRAAHGTGAVEQIDDFRPSERDYINFRLFPELGVSASSQFSERGLAEIKAKIEKARPGARILVLDLREESHGLTAEGIPVSWKRQGDHNWANRGLGEAAILADEAGRVKAIGGMTEAELCRAMDLEYARVPVTDHQRPDDRAVERLLKLVRELRDQNVWIHVHCRAGKGRTTTFLALDQILLSAAACKSIESIVRRQSEAGGVDLFAERAASDYTAGFHQARAQFIRDLYRFVRTTGGAMPWGEWCRAQASLASRPVAATVVRQPPALG